MTDERKDMSADLSLDILLEWYEQMVNIRYFEDNAVSSFRKGLFGGSTHPQIAQEATAVGASAALRPTDQVLATYRGHGHAICRGLSPGSIMAELLCKSTGCCGGRGGSMHLCDTERDFWGTNAIVAAHIPIAAGIALANQRRKEDRVVVVFFGDGATCEGAFFETLNMATLWKVPLVLVCENNGYAISVPMNKQMAIESVAKRADSYGFPGVSVDGNNILDVYSVVRKAVIRAEAGEGPTLVETRVTRYLPHTSEDDDTMYRSREEVEEAKKSDPLILFRDYLLSNGMLTLDADADLLKKAKSEVNTATDEGDAAPYPRGETLYDHVYGPTEAL